MRLNYFNHSFSPIFIIPVPVRVACLNKWKAYYAGSVFAVGKRTIHIHSATAFFPAHWSRQRERERKWSERVGVSGNEAVNQKKKITFLIVSRQLHSKAQINTPTAPLNPPDFVWKQLEYPFILYTVYLSALPVRVRAALPRPQSNRYTPLQLFMHL